LGTIVYVPNYGYAIALDTGDNIKGKVIDLFFHNKNSALKWGKKEIEITIIGKIEDFDLIINEIKKNN
jgi:3D (Asp-Asp-Asp) domain-containing protein